MEKNEKQSSCKFKAFLSSIIGALIFCIIYYGLNFLLGLVSGVNLKDADPEVAAINILGELWIYLMIEGALGFVSFMFATLLWDCIDINSNEEKELCANIIVIIIGISLSVVCILRKDLWLCHFVNAGAIITGIICIVRSKYID